ncbi:cullin-associated NEDD8-dissociated protein 1 [Planococcus citri]|uniref:cullin-associated NEDD8-dissociated protein 1 n=1 Tax=Planococcus citri TaxID=170843 RepID=UPI0031F8EF82
MATSISFQIGHLLEKMTSNDKDFRFMATNDLMAELQKDSIKLDDDSERKIIKMLLKLLEDKNGEVQNLAVKCLGPLVKKVKEFQIEVVVSALCANMASENEQLRDISSIGLKTVINELPLTSNSLVEAVCKNITQRISSVILKQEDISVQLEALDILADLLPRFGANLSSYHSEILQSLLPQLSSSRQAVRKRAIVAMSHFVVPCNHSLYVKLIEHLSTGLEQNTSTTSICTYIQSIAAICRTAGHRFGEHLDRFFPLIQKYSKEDDDELREFCLQAFEAFVQRCPREITPYIPTITELCLMYITYDPNYNYDDGDVDNLMETDEEKTVEEEDEDDEYSDDDDMSWKVRRAAAKCLESVIATRRELITEFYKNVSAQLIARFKEREENVKSDIFHAYITLLKQTKPSFSSGIDNDSMEEEETPISLLQAQVPTIVKAVHIQLRERSIKTRQDCLALLRELINVLPAALSMHVPALIPGIQYSLGDKNSNSNMKINTLSFVHCLFCSHPAEVFHTHMAVLVPPITAAVGDNFYKIAAEALLCLEQLVKVIRPLDTLSSFNFAPYTSKIYDCTLMRLKTADIDQEVKERAISCMGQIICNLGDYLQGELVVCLPIFLDRLKNEITRLTTVKALTKIAASPLRIDLRPIMNEAVPILGTFLRKNHRALKLSTLTLLDTLVNNYSGSLNIALLNTVMVELPPLISDTDFHIAQLTLVLLTSIAKLQPLALSSSSVLPEIINLAKSPLLQGGALSSMLAFFQALVNADLAGLGFNGLLAMLVAPIVNKSPDASSPILHKQAFNSLAKCVAAITVTQKQNAVPVVEKFLSEVRVFKGDEPAKNEVHKHDEQSIFSLRVVGEIGRHIDLHDVDNLKNVILMALSSSSEELKSSASYALGGVAIGNLQQYLPFILNEIESQPKRQYLLLHSLKEVISCQSCSESGVQQLQPFVPAIWRQLFRHCECSEEGTRNVVAECLGKLTLINPSSLLPELKESLNSDSALMRTTVLTAVKFTICDQPQAIDPLLKQNIGHFLKSLEDPDMNVRRVALVAFNSAAHNKPSLVRDLLDQILPKLYAETNVKKELIREVEMGPFKHKVDDGLDIRKAAFECMYTLLDSCLDRLDIFEFLNHLEMGLKDHYDIKMLTYLMVTRLAQLASSAVLQRLERLVEPLKYTCTLKVRANSVKQEFEKQDELKRSALRAVSALLTIPDAGKNPHLNEFVMNIKSSPDLNAIFESIQKDSMISGLEHQTSMDIS